MRSRAGAPPQPWKGFASTRPALVFTQPPTPAVVQIGDTACVQTAWVSEEEIVCRSPAGFGSHLGLQLDLHDGDYNLQRSVIAPDFVQYMGPKVVTVTPEVLPRQVNALVVIKGTNFGAGDVASKDIAVTIGGVACHSVLHWHHSMIACMVDTTQVPASTRDMVSLDVAITVGGAMATFHRAVDLCNTAGGQHHPPPPPQVCTQSLMAHCARVWPLQSPARSTAPSRSTGTTPSTAAPAGCWPSR